MIGLRLHNRSDVVFAASAASVGGQAALGHPPGAALWGVTAGAAYSGACTNTFAQAHSGALRHTPAFPLVGDEPAFPWPECLLEPKHTPSQTRKERRLSKDVWSTLHLNGARPGPGEVLKGWYLSSSGKVTKPATAERGKTAIQEGERRAASGEYFQYEHLKAGQDWLSWIAGDGQEEAAGDLVACDLRLGRSAMQEYGGGFRATALATFTDPREAQLAGKARAGGPLILWCLSDLACLDDWGLPNLAPAPADLGVSAFKGELNRALSVVTVRRHAPWNAWLDGPDREHAVIAAGSVLVYDLEEEIDLERFRESCGRWRERGLGLVWPNPPLLAHPRPSETLEGRRTEGVSTTSSHPSAPPDPASVPTPVTAEEAAVFAFLERAAGRRAADVELDKAARAYEARFATALAALPPGDPKPSASQWSLLAQTIETHGLDDAALQKALVHPATGLCASDADRDWAGLLPLIKDLLEEATLVAPALAHAAWRIRKLYAGGGDG